MNIEEIKDKVANKHGWNKFNDIIVIKTDYVDDILEEYKKHVLSNVANSFFELRKNKEGNFYFEGYDEGVNDCIEIILELNNNG